jgi:ubiquinone/menaquinone biosynthesis C-methylase UbiE
MGNSEQTEHTERVRRLWQRAAPSYDRQMRVFEKLQFGGGRAWVCSQASGDTLEVAIGTGSNLEFYPPGTPLTGIDLSAAMLDIARTHAADLGRDVELIDGDAQALPFEDSSFDTVVCTLPSTARRSGSAATTSAPSQNTGSNAGGNSRSPR